MKTKVSIFSILCCLIVSLSVSAENISPYTARQDTIGLWPNGAPNGDSDQQARIYVFLPEKTKATGRAVIACPGGSYYGCLPDLEGNNWAPFFNKQGIALIVLQYRLPRKKKDVPISDAYEAIRVVKDSADNWNINKKDIGIMGSSAGGHLASTIATHAPAESRPAFQILFYPVISMTVGLTHADSRTNFLGTSPTQADIDLYSNEKQVTETTPRAFIIFADDDYTVTPKNGAQYYQALRDKRIPASLFIYPKGSHGFGATKEINFRDQMENNLILWLNDFGEEYVHGMPETLSIEGGAVTENEGHLGLKKEGGIFEIYTSLTAGTYSFDDADIPNGGTVTEAGIYRIRVDYHTDPVTVDQQKINRVYAWYPWGQLDLFDLSYTGNSTFKTENKTWTPTSDNRYRIRMQVGDANTIETYGPKDGGNFVLIGNGQWGAGNDYNYGVDRSKYFKTDVPFNMTVNLSPATGYSVTVEEYIASSSLSPESATEDVVISPTAVNNSFNISSSQAGFSVEVISASGNTVLRDSTGADSLTISGINFSSGVYFVKVMRDNQVISTKRIIKS